MLIKLMNIRARVKINRCENHASYVKKLTMLIKTNEVNRDDKLT